MTSSKDVALSLRELADKLPKQPVHLSLLQQALRGGAADIEQLRAQVERLTVENRTLRAMADGKLQVVVEQSRASVETAALIPVKDEREIEELRAALKVARQALMEFSHAQECGPQWYTRGESGMYAQVRLWMRRGHEAISKALGPYDENGRFLKEMPAVEPTRDELRQLVADWCAYTGDTGGKLVERSKALGIQPGTASLPGKASTSQTEGNTMPKTPLEKFLEAHPETPVCPGGAAGTGESLAFGMKLIAQQYPGHTFYYVVWAVPNPPPGTTG